MMSSAIHAILFSIHIQISTSDKTVLRNENAFGAYYNIDALSEIAMDYNNWQYPTLIKGTYNAETGIVRSKWQTCYDGIYRANLLLQNIDNVDISDEQKAVYSERN